MMIAAAQPSGKKMFAAERGASRGDRTGTNDTMARVDATQMQRWGPTTK
jgi:hypothetical protein